MAGSLRSHPSMRLMVAKGDRPANGCRDVRAVSDEQVERAARAHAVEAVLGGLDERAGEIVRRRYGLGGHEPQTHV